MSQTVPSVAEINATIISEIESSIGQTIPLLPRAFCRVLAKALAAVFVSLFRYSSWMSLQAFAAYAAWDATTINGRSVRPLIELGRAIGVGDPEPATSAEADVTVTVKVQSGSVAAGSLLIRSDTGYIYAVTSAVLLNAASVTIHVKAVDDSENGGGLGAGGNLVAGNVLSFASPLANVNRECVVSAVTVTAADEESEQEYRDRVIRRWQRKPQGGARADYVAWGEEVAGVVRVFPYAGAPGIVELYIEADSEIDPDGVPTQAVLDAVECAVEYDGNGEATRKPVSAVVDLRPITRAVFGVAIDGLAVDNKPTVLTDVSDAVDDHLRSLEPYIEGISILPRADRVLSADIGGIVSDVVRAAGGTFTEFQLLANGLPVVAYTLSKGELAKLGEVSEY